MTIAQQLKIKDFPFIIKNKQGKEIYWEGLNGYWLKSEFDTNGNNIYYESSHGYWAKREYNSDGKKIYWESSNGKIIDNRPKLVEVHLSMDEIAAKFGIDVSTLKIKK